MKYPFLLAMLFCSATSMADSERFDNGRLVSTGMSRSEIISTVGSPTQTKNVKTPYTDMECYQASIDASRCPHQFKHHEEWIYQGKNRVITLILRDSKVVEIQSTIAR